MNKETQRIIVASVLITLVAYFYPNFRYVDNNEPNIDYKETYITKASEVKNFSIVPFVIDHLGIILSVDKINIDTYATVN